MQALRKYMTSKQVAEALGYTNIRSLYNAVRLGRVPKPAVVIGRNWFFKPSDIAKVNNAH